MIDRQPPRRTALVTGASAGIGAEFARVFAAQGFDVVITARRSDRLAAIGAELLGRHRVAVHELPDDLADPAAPARLVEQIRARGLHVDALVNNAGYGVGGAYVSTPWRAQADLLQVMVNAVAELTHRLLPGMLERGYGRIINVASLAGLLPAVAGHTLYAASKSFLVRFSQSLAMETAGRGVHVTALCPGFTYSEFHDVSGTRAQVNRLPRWMWLDAPTVARQGYDAVMRGDVVYVNGRVNRAIARIGHVVPESLVLAVMRRQGSKFRKV